MSNIKTVDNKKINLDSNNLNLGSKNQSNGNDTIIKKINSYITTSIESYAIESLNEYYKLSEGIYDINKNMYGEFGGNQGVFDENYVQYIKDEKVKDIINKYYPNEEITEEDLQLLFSRMDHIGCGYVAGCNSIYNNAMKNMSYKEFQDKFGFPPYSIKTVEEGEEGKKINYQYEKGLINYHYEYMYLDVFLYYQKNYMNFKSIEEIYGNEKENLSQNDRALDDNNFQTVGARGTHIDVVARIISRYLNEKGIRVSYYGSPVYILEKYNNLEKYGFIDDNSDITENNIDAYKKALEEGKEIVISSSSFDLHYVLTDRNGNLKATNKIMCKDVGGHAMSVVAIDQEKGKLIVSTWGRCAAIDINDVKRFIIYDFD